MIGSVVKFAFEVQVGRGVEIGVEVEVEVEVGSR